MPYIFNQCLQYRIISLVPGGTYRSASRWVCRPPTIGRYHRLRLFPPHYRPKQVSNRSILIVAACYWAVLAAAWLRHGYDEKEGEEARKKREGEEEGELHTTLPSNGEAATRLLFRRILRPRLQTSAIREPQDGAADERTLRGGNFFAVVFSL
ncbi:hypothetical protein BHM03_00060426 [Ensete ventricosum]|nr:hypothetical protein BHM03_00060426 [Ensete ventricosum]